MKTRINVAKDVMSGKKVKEVLKTRIPEGIKQTTSELQFQLGDQKPTEQQPKRQRRPAAAVIPKKNKKSLRGPKIRYRQQPKRKDIFLS